MLEEISRSKMKKKEFEELQRLVLLVSLLRVFFVRLVLVWLFFVCLHHVHKTKSSLSHVSKEFE